MPFDNAYVYIYIYILYIHTHIAASQNVKPRSIPWTHRPIHTPDPYQNAGDPDRSIRLDHRGPIHTRILTQPQIFLSALPGAIYLNLPRLQTFAGCSEIEIGCTHGRKKARGFARFHLWKGSSFTCKIIWVCNALHSSNSKRSIHPSTRFCLVDTWKQAENETCPLVQQVEGVRSVRWTKTADSMQGFAAWLARPWLKRARLCSLDVPDYGRHVTLLVA